jgi:chitin disaccharide deacetylase
LIAKGDFVKKEILQKLGYTEQDRILVINGDDFGMCHAANVGTAKFLSDFPGNSATLMVPCPWAYEAIQMWRSHPQWSIGLELTLTSEWETYRWGPVSPREKVPSLVDEDGCFWGNNELFNKHAKPQEVEIEINAQIQRILSLDLKPTHLNNHMFITYERPDMREVYLRTVKKYQLPARLRSLQDDLGWPSIDGMLAGEIYYMSASGREDRLYEIIKEMKPGLWELYPHFAVDCEESRAIMSYSRFFPDDTNSWRGRQNDIDIYTGARFHQFIRENNIKVTSWAALNKIVAQQQHK